MRFLKTQREKLKTNGVLPVSLVGVFVFNEVE